MCDYSLGSIPNRPAAVGEELMVYRFPMGITGLACPADVARRTGLPQTTGKKIWRCFVDALGYNFDDKSVPAVCMPPGAFLMLQHIHQKMQKKHGIQAEEGVTFVQMDATLNAYRDAFRFQNGKLIRIQDLPQGLGVKVLSLVGVGEFEDGTMAGAVGDGEPVLVRYRTREHLPRANR